MLLTNTLQYFVLYPFIIHMSTYWLTCNFFFALDFKYLDPNHTNWKKYGKAAITSLFNQVFISLPTLYLLSNHLKDSVEKSAYDSIMVTLLKIFLIVNLSNFLFYWCHRLLHNTYIYKHIHMKHHEFVEPIAVAAFYANPIEHLFANTLCFLIPFILIGSSYYIMIFMLTVGTFVTVLAHVTYYANNEHVVHHKLYKYNFGFSGYIDMIFNTYKLS